MKSLRTPLLVLAAVFALANGYIHLMEWLDVYRDVPSQVDGAWVVRIGFPLNAAGAVVVAALLGAAVLRPALRWLAIGSALAFQAGSLAVLIASRTGTVFGWTEPVWTDAAEQSRAVEIGGIAVLVALIGLEIANRAGADDRLAVPA